MVSRLRRLLGRLARGGIRAILRSLPPVHDDIVVIDSQFPQRVPLAFRNTEINEYFRRVANVRSYAMYPMAPDAGAWFTHGYGTTAREYAQSRQGYLTFYPQNRRRIRRLMEHRRYRFNLAYTFFLAETYVALPFLEKNRTPFVFVLYPGGSFGLDNEASDRMLARVFASEFFREVIVTQQRTWDYLVGKGLCEPGRMSFVYGGFPAYRAEQVHEKLRYPEDKPTLDVCFVAAKYSERGVDKGYDLFIDAARRVAKQEPSVHFHVVGGFTAGDIDVLDIADRLTFHGYQRPDYLLDFYSRMDAIVSPNRPGQLYPGNFDGFPLNPDAAFCGSAMFVSDELGLNLFYADGEEIVVIPLDGAQIAALLLRHLKQPEALYALAARGMATTQELFDIDLQVERRLDVFRKYATVRLR
ncbi:glycosyltransferase [soil metagenome]